MNPVFAALGLVAGYILTLCLLALISGCGGGEASINHGYGDHFDILGPEGLRLRYAPTLIADSDFAIVWKYEAIHRELQACAGLTAVPPMTIIVPQGALTHPYMGWYYANPALVLVDTTKPFIAFRHEDLHHLLQVNTGDLDPGHKSPLWVKCSPLMPK